MRGLERPQTHKYAFSFLKLPEAVFKGQEKRLHLLKAVNHIIWIDLKKKKALIMLEKFLLLRTRSQHKKVEIVGIKN